MIQLTNTVVHENTVLLSFSIKNARLLANLNMTYHIFYSDKLLISGSIERVGDHIIEVEIPATIVLIPGDTKLSLEFENDQVKGIHSLWQYTEKGFVADNTVHAYPSRMIGFSLTNACNLNCSMCWQQDRKEKHYLSLKAIQKTIESVVHFGRPPVYLWGGEPLMHPQIWDIVSYLKSKFFFTIINTNGYLLDEHIEQILDSRLDMLIISIDGLEEIHNKIRGSNKAYIRLIESIRKIRDRKNRRPIVTINCVINEQNYTRLDDLVALKSELGAEYLEFQFMMFFSDKEKEQYNRMLGNCFGEQGRSVKYYPQNQDKIDIEVLMNEIEKIKALKDKNIRFFPYVLNSRDKIKDYYENPSRINIKTCENIHKSVWIEPNGDIVPCSCFPDFSVGNINEQDFYSLWNHERFCDFRKKLDKSLFSICYRCCDFYKTDLFQTS